MLNFEVAGGSITGKYHLGNFQVLKAKNNQDSYQIAVGSNKIIGIVCDGCGSTSHAEVGATLTTQMMLKHMADYEKTLKEDIVLTKEVIHQILDYAQDKTVEGIEKFAKENLVSENIQKVILDYFLNTIVGFYMSEEDTVLFNCGDGVFFINGEMTELGPFPNNAPPYLCYRLFDMKDLFLDEDSDFGLQYNDYKTKDIQSLLIGTDGVMDLIAVENNKMPGLNNEVGSIDQFWTQDFYFKNFDSIKQKLSVINKDYMAYDNEQGKVIVYGGLLRDDTTLITVRRILEDSNDIIYSEQNNPDQ